MKNVTGIILAGGAGSRLGGADKGLQAHAGRPLVGQVIERLRPQVDSILISCNRNLGQYAEYGCPVVTDEMPLFSGPLAGLSRCLRDVEAPLCLTVPCDNPEIPPDLTERLHASLQLHPDARVAIAHDGEHLQPLYALIDTGLRDELQTWLDAGGRAPRAWYPEVGMAIASFEDCPQLFRNLNTPNELRGS